MHRSSAAQSSLWSPPRPPRGRCQWTWLYFLLLHPPASSAQLSRPVGLRRVPPCHADAELGLCRGLQAFARGEDLRHRVDRLCARGELAGKEAKSVTAQQHARRGAKGEQPLGQRGPVKRVEQRRNSPGKQRKEYGAVLVVGAGLE
ncbi:hypothetical protein AAT19DRAFT_13108 [Rhodotorula toruloides]|uniref:Uncharacterized protein n=1 Tax=Rhodotorula toruloides TaxID=5286 RepID=A0A2T0ADJ4_RHOTO|nr:hypothetical protein AAT19DRAFT_13108 [Rhodotorula toruloides]